MGGSLKLIISVLLFTFIFSGFISADNYKEFIEDESNYGKISVSNKNNEKLAEYILLSNTNTCLINCEANGIAKLFSRGELFTDLNFRDLVGLTEIKGSKILIKKSESYNHEINDYEKKCYEESNGTYCVNRIVGSHQENKTRTFLEEYDGSVLEPGMYEWKIEGRKDRFKNIDWIASSFGIDLTDWAWWNTSYNLQRNLTGMNESLIFPVNGTSEININGTNFIIYGMGEDISGTTAFYYSDASSASPSAIANDSDEFFKIISFPFENKSGIPGNLTAFVPMDIKNSTKNITNFIDTSGFGGFEIINQNGLDDGVFSNFTHNISHIFGGYHLKNGTGSNFSQFLFNGSETPINRDKGCFYSVIEFSGYPNQTGSDRFYWVESRTSNTRFYWSALNWEFQLGGTVILSTAWNASDVQPNTVHHVFWCWDTVNDNYKIVVDKKLIASDTTPASATSDDMYVFGSGTAGGGAGRALSLNVSHIAFYNSYLTSAQINSTYDAFSVGTTLMSIESSYEPLQNATFENLNVINTGFFANIGSSVIRVVKGWFNEIDVSGNANIAGNLTIGYEQVINTCSNATIRVCNVSCSSGKQILSGGCRARSAPINATFPSSATTWMCNTNKTATNITAYAICGRLY
ncbi:MAG: hypothetical protein AABX93_02310 [Nanoarchaeota archaeon]